MNPYVLAFLVIGPVSFLAGLAVAYFLFAGRSSTPPNNQTLKELVMAVFAELQQPLADLTSAVEALPAKLAALEGAGAQDKADTLGAVLPALQSATDAINGVGATTTEG